MSAFVVGNKTIDKPLSYIFNYLVGGGHSYQINDILDLNYIDELSLRKELNRLGNDMMALNVESVNYRYKADDKAIAQMFSLSEPCSLAQAIKSISCFLYQACEGECNKTKLYKTIENLRNYLAYSYFQETDDWKNGEWG